MQIVTDDIGQKVLKELHGAIEAHLAVAFFSPSKNVQEALSALPNLSLVISEEFTINDPGKIESLPRHFVIRSLPPEGDKGKLHAKVLIVARADKSSWALVGSANMTYQGLFANQEACVALDSRERTDCASIKGLTTWFESVLRDAREPDLVLARKIFDARSAYRLERRPKPQTEASTRYWILKTTSGSDGMEHWSEFVSGNCIAIGWERLNVDPSEVTDATLLKSLKKSYPDRSQKLARNTIRKFISMKEGELILICRGYAINQSKPVHVYGLARVTGPFRAEPYNGRLWRFKHDAAIQVVQTDFPMKALAAALDTGSSMRALVEIDEAAFERFVSLLTQSGIQVDV
jgi:hypothetical protein